MFVNTRLGANRDYLPEFLTCPNFQLFPPLRGKRFFRLLSESGYSLKNTPRPQMKRLDRPIARSASTSPQASVVSAPESAAAASATAPAFDAWCRGHCPAAPVSRHGAGPQCRRRSAVLRSAPRQRVTLMHLWLRISLFWSPCYRTWTDSRRPRSSIWLRTWMAASVA